ncbi:MAG: hypothetical protein ACREMQ_09970 [Longimicrobiales bacterium]
MNPRKTACVVAACLTAASIGGAAQADQRTDLRAALKQIYEPSTIEVQAKAVEGRVARRGALLRLEADGVSAKPFRVIQANTKSPRFHVRDYALVEIASDRTVTVESGELRLSRGTEVVVLDIRVEGGAVQLLTHTSQPVRHTDGRAAYGCTEFILRLDPSTMAAGDLGRVRESIERWLSLRS